MTTMALTTASIRSVLQDRPDETTTTASMTNSVASVTVTDITKFAVGQVWEFDDGATGAEDVLIRSVTDSSSTIGIKRGHLGSTATSHSNSCVMLKEPKYRFDEVAQAVNTVLDADLFQEGLFDLAEHQIVTSTTTDYYNAPTTSCIKFLDVYQMPASYTEPQRAGIRYTPYPRNADTSLYSNGSYFVIQGNYGLAGADVYYVTCAHNLALSTADSAEERIVLLLGAAYLLEWAEPKRIAGPNNQGDITVRPNTGIQTAAYYRGLAEELMSKKKRAIEDRFPPTRRFVRS